MWQEIMQRKDLRLGMIVYHRDIYDYREQMKVVGITEDTLTLEGDLSGGTHGVCHEIQDQKIFLRLLKIGCLGLK